MSSQIQTSYAPSDRALCRGCKKITNTQKMGSDHHYHLECYQIKKCLREYPIANIKKLEEISKQDQKLVIKRVKEEQEKQKKQTKKKISKNNK